MEILRIAALALLGVCLIALLRQQRPEFAPPATVVVGIVILLVVVQRLGSMVAVFAEAASGAGILGDFTGLVLKITGIAYVADFTAQACRDANESAIAAKVELAGKIIILSLALPLVTSILQTINMLLD
ncbi:MAG TPA: stage III sporulation protein AD [Firmicutes bacterium]|nr:stage III sporulation protein AD [Bacillota bacterium]